jgi:CRISPR system Cascade subunit CasA
MHLINDPWLPVKRTNGSRHLIRPCELVGPDIVDVDLPRADLAVAARTFLIGLVTTAGLADTESEWRRLYDNPPTGRSPDFRLAAFRACLRAIGRRPPLLSASGNGRAR